MRKRKRARTGLTLEQLMTYLAHHAPTGYQCHTTRVSSDGRWLAECTVIVDGWPVSALDIRETFPSHGAALAYAYAAACEREQAVWQWDTALPIGIN